MHYHIYFSIRRGGIGLPYELAKAEFISVFNPHGLHITEEYSVRRHLWADLDLPPDQVIQLASNLGYTEAILHVCIEPYLGETLTYKKQGRWYIGWRRQKTRKIHQRELFVQRPEESRRDAPDQRPFLICKNGETRPAAGHHLKRSLSARDARFLLSVAQLPPAANILDPFAGFGGIVVEAQRRGQSIVAADRASELAPGLAALSPGRYIQADAQSLPFAPQTFDAIITEPPFHPSKHQDLLNAIPELHRVVKPTGKLVLLIAQNMEAFTTGKCAAMGLSVHRAGIIPRDRGLRCPVLVIQPLTRPAEST